MGQYAYLGERGRGRIIRLGGHATDQVLTDSTTAPVLLLAETWDITPAGEAGDCVFRMALVTVKYSNGFAIQVTPTVDGTARAPQQFTGAGAGLYTAQVWIAERGTRLSLLIEQLTRAGDLEIVNVRAAGKIIRMTP